MAAKAKNAWKLWAAVLAEEGHAELRWELAWAAHVGYDEGDFYRWLIVPPNRPWETHRIRTASSRNSDGLTPRQRVGSVKTRS